MKKRDHPPPGFYFVLPKRPSNLAIFVGLWTPKILNLGQTLVDDED